MMLALTPMACSYVRCSAPATSTHRFASAELFRVTTPRTNVTFGPQGKPAAVKPGFFRGMRLYKLLPKDALELIDECQVANTCGERISGIAKRAAKGVSCACLLELAAAHRSEYRVYRARPIALGVVSMTYAQMQRSHNGKGITVCGM